LKRIEYLVTLVLHHFCPWFSPPYTHSAQDTYVTPLNVNGKMHALPVSGPDTVKHALLEDAIVVVVVTVVVVVVVVGVVVLVVVVVTVVTMEVDVEVDGELVVVLVLQVLVLHTGVPLLSQTQVLQSTV